MSAAEQSLAELRLARQRCARRFGEAKRNGEDLAQLKAEMQRLGAEIEALEGELAGASDAQSRPVPESNPAPEPERTPEPEHETRFGRPPFPPRFSASSVGPEVSGPVGVRAVTAQDRAAWEAYVEAHPQASLYHHAAWRELVARTMRHEDVSLIAHDGTGRVVGVLPLIAMRSRLFGAFAVSLPYFNYAGPLADSAAVEQRLLQAAGALAGQGGLSHVEVRETRARAGWPAREDKVAMIRALPASDAALDAELGSKLRAQVRRATREDPRWRVGGVELLDDFYRVFARNMRDLGTPVYARGFFAAVLAAWPQRAHVVVVDLRGEPVACALLLGYRDMLEIPWASTLREVNALGINMFMYRRILAFAIERGYGWFDFGRSTVDAGTYRFKQQWGAVPLPNRWHYWLPPGHELPRLNPDNPKYRLLIAVWQRLPVWLTRLVGPPVVRNIP